MTTYTFIPLDRPGHNNNLKYRFYFEVDGTTPRSLTMASSPTSGRNTILFPENLRNAIRAAWENTRERFYLDPELHKWFLHADLPLDLIGDMLGHATTYQDMPEKFLRVLFNLARRVYLLSPELQEAYPSGLPLDWPGFEVPHAQGWEHFSIDTAVQPGLVYHFIDVWPTRHHGLGLSPDGFPRVVLLRYVDDLVWRHETSHVVKADFDPDTPLDVSNTALEVTNMLPESVSFESVRDGIAMLLANNT